MRSKSLRHSLIQKKARFIDKFVDEYKKVRRSKNFPHKAVGTIIPLLFPGGKYSGRGAFKTVHKISSRARDLVLKTSHTRNIRNDERVYQRIPANIRYRYFAKVYWRTRYCLLQKYGVKRKIPRDVLMKLKSVAKQYGLTDVRDANIRLVEGEFKIVDANISRKKRR